MMKDKILKYANINENPFAVFVVAQLSSGKIAATTRPLDRNKDDNKEGKIGLPGGKVDGDEDPMEAAKREAKEEGWEVSGLTFKYSERVQNNIVWWYHAKHAKKLEEYKEKHRLIPIEVEKEKLIGFGNERAVPACLK